MNTKSDRPGTGPIGWLLATGTLLAAVSGCEQVAGIDDRDVYTGATGGQGGTTSSSGGGQGGTGGQTGGAGGSGGGVGCSPSLGAWPDSTPRCVGGGSCAEGEDGAEVTVAPSYETCPGQDVVHDVVTGLFWEKNAGCDGCSHAAAEIHCDLLTEHGAGGFDDWRVPTLRELVSIMDFGLVLPVVALTFSQETGFFVSDDLKVDTHWGARFGPGHLTWWEQGVSANARCVRGAGPASTFELDSNTDTVVDSGLSLEWTRDAASGGPFTWDEARLHCNDLSDPPGGWRLPTAKEHMTIYIPTAIGGDFPPGFTATPQSYWTSTADPLSDSRAMAVHYVPTTPAEGALDAKLIGLNHHALCVRAHP